MHEEINPKLSIIIPVYNIDKYIHECIDSVLGQSFHDFELILVNDGSKDLSPSICDEYAEKDGRVSVIHQKNAGLSGARNSGIKQAKGEFILFIDGDDFYSDINVFEKLVGLAERNDFDILMFLTKRYFESDDKFIFEPEYDTDKVNGKPVCDVVEYMITSQAYSNSACTKLIRRSYLLENSLFFKEGILYEDLDWFYGVLSSDVKIHALSEYFYVYRMCREGSINHSVNLKLVSDMLDTIERWQKVFQRENRFYMGLLSYALVITMVKYSGLNKEDKHAIKERIKSFSWLLNYDVNSRVRIVKNVYKIFGLTICTSLLGFYSNKKQ